MEQWFPRASRKQYEALRRRITTHLRFTTDHPDYGAGTEEFARRLKGFISTKQKYVLDKIVIKGRETNVLIEEVEGEYIEDLRHPSNLVGTLDADGGHAKTEEELDATDEEDKQEANGAGTFMAE